MEGADPRTDGELLVATATDPGAFGTFYRRHVRGLLAFFRRRGASAEVALDLTAETFAAALEASPRYELRPEPARNWLYGIAWNKLHEAQRRGSSDDCVRRALGMAPIALTDEGIERIEALAGAPALEVMESLPAPQRDGHVHGEGLTSALLAGSSHAEDEDPFRRQEALQAHSQRQSARAARVLDPHPREEDAQAQAASGKAVVDQRAR